MDRKPEAVIILKAEEDFCRTYNLGVNMSITKSVSFNGLVSVMGSFVRYRFGNARHPDQCDN